jgi:hypothetical protein
MHAADNEAVENKKGDEIKSWARRYPGFGEISEARMEPIQKHWVWMLKASSKP